MKNYITPEGQDAIRNFQYKGGSNSYSYKYVWSPIAEFVLTYFIPRSLAPNLITLIGTIILLAGWFTLGHQNSIKTPLQPITILIFAASIFIYQTMDNVDGKQARRMKCSSPLGMLFDHGCDALVSIFLGYGLARVVFMRNEITIIAVCFIGQLGFYLSVWTQYHANGLMILGRVNAIDDGIPFAWVLCILTYLIGQQFWIKKDFFEMQNSYGIVAFTFFGSIIQVGSLLKNTKGNFTKNRLEALNKLWHLLLRVGSLMTIIYYTDWYKEEKYFYHIFFSLSLPFVRDITYLQICVVTLQKYEQFQNPTLVYIFSYPTYILLREYAGITLMNEQLFVNLLTIYFVFEYLHFAVAIVYQLSRVLNIKVFRISQVKLNQSKSSKNPEKDQNTTGKSQSDNQDKKKTH